jgi:hypothetical protein
LSYDRIFSWPMCVRLPRPLLLTPIWVMLVSVLCCPPNALSGAQRTANKDKYDRFEVFVERLYREIGLRWRGLSFDVFRYALIGYFNLQESNRIKRPGILTIIDFTRPSTAERLYVIDLKGKKLLYRSLVAHGKGTGDLYARRFSNTPNSKKSSLGFFLTSETYYGKHGYSLRLDGEEKGVNDRARSRAIVMHGADYVSRAFAERIGRIGRSWGCPAVPKGIHRRIIDAIKGGTLLFQFGDQEEYLKNSAFLKLRPAMVYFALAYLPPISG